MSGAPKRKKKTRVSPIYSVAVTWLVLSALFPPYALARIIAIGLASAAAFFSVRSYVGSKYGEEFEEVVEQTQQQAQQPQQAQEKSYGAEVDAIIAEGKLAQKELGRLYASIPDLAIKRKIRDIMEVSDKIIQDAKDDPNDVPQIKKFLDYYLPTTIKLLNTYDRMSAQGISGENLDKSMKSITEMLDTAIEAYKRRLDSLFENQAMDIETDIQVMNTMLAREGLAGEKDFIVEEQS